MLKYWNIEVTSNLSDFQQTWRLQTCNFRTNPEISFRCADNTDPYIYGRIFGQLGKIRLLDPFVTSIGYLTTFLSLLVLVFLTVTLCKGNNKALFFAVTIFFSPPMQLLIQRANLDLVIACSIIISLYLLKHNYIFLSFLIIAVISLIKFYPIFVLGVYFIRNKTFAKFRSIQLSCLVVLGLVGFEVSQMRENLPNPVWAGFGLKANVFWISKIVQANQILFFGLIAGTALTFYILFSLSRVRTIFKRISKIGFDSNSMFLSFSIVFIFIFISVNSFDYRLIFLNVAFLFYLVNVSAQPDSKWISPTVSLLLFGANWFSFNSSNELQLVGDFFILALFCILVSLTSNALFNHPREISG
jgi:hypothetical protein